MNANYVYLLNILLFYILLNQFYIRVFRCIYLNSFDPIGHIFNSDNHIHLKFYICIFFVCCIQCEIKLINAVFRDYLIISWDKNRCNKLSYSAE